MDRSFFAKDIILEDEVVLLRPLLESDVENLVTISENEPETWTFSQQKADGRENLVKYIQLALSEKVRLNQYPFIVFDKKSGTYAGSTRFYDINDSQKTLLLGYTWYGSAYRGTGLNKHCKYLLLSYAFETLGMHRVEFRADHNNQRSIAAMKSIGCTVEGVLRSTMFTGEADHRRDSIVLSILKNEWFTSVKEQLRQKL